MRGDFQEDIRHADLPRYKEAVMSTLFGECVGWLKAQGLTAGKEFDTANKPILQCSKKVIWIDQLNPVRQIVLWFNSISMEAEFGVADKSTEPKTVLYRNKLTDLRYNISTGSEPNLTKGSRQRFDEFFADFAAQFKTLLASLLITITLLILTASTHAQTLPRWRAGAHIRVEARGLTDKERERVKAAIGAWRPLLPDGLTIEIGTPANVTIIRATVDDRELETCDSFAFNSLIDEVMIRIDPRAGSGGKFQRVAEHAIGHALGLGHRPKSVMAERDANSLRIAIWKIKGKTYHPDREDAAALNAIYAQPHATGPILLQGEREDVAAPNTTDPVQRYSFHRKVTQGNRVRESDFVWADNGKLIEINVKGDSINVPQFPVGTNVSADWWARLSHTWIVAWRPGAEVVEKGGGDEKLEFPVEAWSRDGKTRVEMSNYRLHRVSSTVTPVDNNFQF